MKRQIQNDIRLKHKCNWHADTDSLVGIMHPGMKYYRWQFVAECPRCHKRVVVKCTNQKNAEEVMAGYPVLVRFPK